MPESSETIHLSGRLSWLDHKHIHRLVLPLRRRLVIHSVVLLLVFLAISAFRAQAPIGPIAFAVFVVIYCVMLWRLQRRGFVKRQAKLGRDQIEIDGSGVFVRAADQETRFAWSAFESVTRDDRFIVLRGREVGRLPMVILPKSWCSTEGDWTRIEQLVAKWLPPVAGVFTTKQARQFRLEYLPAEYALKRSVFLLLAMSLVITLVSFVVPFDVANGHGPWYVVLFRVQSALMTAVCCLATWGVRRFAAWLRLPLQVLAALCLPLFPLGTVLGVRILYLLATGPEPRLLTSEYEQIVRIAGPMKIQNSSRIRPFIWVVLALVILIIVLVGLISLIPEEFRHNL